MRFSVVIPVYNGEKTIGKALTSVAKQIVENFEVIVVNDGSTDGTLKEIQNFIEQHPELTIKVISNHNNGRSVSRNIGVIAAKGDFICFLDADDEFKQNHLEEFNKAISLYPEVGFFFADAEVIRVDNNWAKFNGFLERLMKRGEYWKTNGYYVVFDERFPVMLVQGSLIPMCSTAIQRDILILSGLFNPSFSVAEDFELWFRISLTNKMIAINKQLSNVYHHSDNTSNPKNTYKNTLKDLKVNKYILENTPKLNKQLQQLLNQKVSELTSGLLYYASDISPSEVMAIIIEQPVVKYGHFLFALKQLIKSVLKKCLRLF